MTATTFDFRDEHRRRIIGIICQRCGAVYNIDGSLVAQSESLSKFVRLGYKIGICHNCLGKEEVDYDVLQS